MLWGLRHWLLDGSLLLNLHGLLCESRTLHLHHSLLGNLVLGLSVHPTGAAARGDIARRELSGGGRELRVRKVRHLVVGTGAVEWCRLSLSRALDVCVRPLWMLNGTRCGPGLLDVYGMDWRRPLRGGRGSLNASGERGVELGDRAGRPNLLL